MGTQYINGYGIGVKLKKLDDDEIDDLGFDCMLSYVEYLVQENDELFNFSSGNAYFSDDGMEDFLCIKNPKPTNISEFENKIKKFKKYLKNNNIKYEGDVDCVGGLYIG